MDAIKIGTTVKLTDASKKMFTDIDSNVLMWIFLAQAFNSKTGDYYILPVNDNVNVKYLITYECEMEVI